MEVWIEDVGMTEAEDGVVEDVWRTEAEDGVVEGVGRTEGRGWSYGGCVEDGGRGWRCGGCGEGRRQRDGGLWPPSEGDEAARGDRGYTDGVRPARQGDG